MEVSKPLCLSSGRQIFLSQYLLSEMVAPLPLSFAYCLPLCPPLPPLHAMEDDLEPCVRTHILLLICSCQKPRLWIHTSPACVKRMCMLPSSITGMCFLFFCFLFVFLFFCFCVDFLQCGLPGRILRY